MTDASPSRGIVFSGVRFGYASRTLWQRLAGMAPPPPALDCPSLRIGPGLTLLLGPNGAGKSTLLKLAAGIEAPERGTITVDGFDLWRDERAARQSIAYAPEQPDLSPYVALGEVLRLVSALRGVPADAGEEALLVAGLGGLAGRSVRELSMGQRRRAILAAAFVGRPATLLLDEPLESLDRNMREMVIDWLFRRVADGATALVSTHDLTPFLDRATAVVAVNTGVPRIEQLPADGVERRTQLDALARGPGPSAPR